MARFELHGLVVESPVDLPAPTAESATPVDWVLTLSEGPSAATFVAERVVAELDLPGARYQARVGAAGLCIEYAGLAEVRFFTDGRAEVYSLGAERAALVAIFCGSALALQLTLRGCLVLHASAVALGARGVAFLGPSNSGKTTLAAQCARVGAAVVSDDVLRVDCEGGRATFREGARDLRLRARSHDLAQGWQGPIDWSTGDGRLVLGAAGAIARSGRLEALVFPLVSAHRSEPSLHALDGADALARICMAPRIRGLSDRAALAQQLASAAMLVREVPAFEAEMPQGPPFLDAWARKLLADLLR